MRMEDEPLILEGIKLDVNKASRKTNQRKVFGTDIDENPLILNGIGLFSNTGSKEMTLDEAEAEGFNILPEVDDEMTLPPLDDEMTLDEAEVEGFNILPALDDEIKTPSSNKLPQLTDEDLKYLNGDKVLTLNDGDISDLGDSSFRLPKPPML